MKLLHNIKRKVISLIFLVGVCAGLLAALPATEVIHKLSSNEFCSSCHTMEPMAETFKLSVHGGNNAQGFVAECVDCHLPKSNIIEELYVKGTSGTRHLWGEYVLGMKQLDYEELHPKRTEYVYDSGCVNCHKDLERRALKATADGKVSDWTHNLAFKNKAEDPQWKCSSCHYDIAHPHLEKNMRERAEETMRLTAVGEL
ncbi:NapC/NirT family cytochrome c [Vibrio sp. SS-MA-C1-2]|uniref:cytochrome c3 family protein n=1 Tax=Vibrio sp. SS-MA-C1-2 TaxID=2908646 RepID=UPI001F46F2DE|nr:NapC/NirT family cytochrome c [Vibrio sp. SS-MA-C1-2]UJF17282.1 NapC/NirT family cytochrome c [Vibrio sp. SS-MA-C1-2]